MTDSALFNFDAALERKSIRENPDGSLTVSGYASTYLNTDREGDIVQPGAFDDAIRTFFSRGAPMLFGHSYSKPIGRWTDAKLDSKGLWLEGKVVKPTTADSYLAEIWNLVKQGVVRGISMGGKFVREGNKIVSVDLYEASLAPTVINPEARLDDIAVKSFRDPAPSLERNDENVETELLELSRRVAEMAKLVDGRKSIPAGMAFSAPAKAQPTDAIARYGEATNHRADDAAAMRRSLAWRDERERQERARAERRRDALLAGEPEPRWETEIPYAPPAGWRVQDAPDQAVDLCEAVTGRRSGPPTAAPANPDVDFLGRRVASTLKDDDLLTVEQKFRREQHDNWATTTKRRLEKLIKNQG